MRPTSFRVAAAILLAASLGVTNLCRAATLNVTLPNVTCMPGDVVDVPIQVSASPTGLGILSIDFRMTLDSTVVFGSLSKPDGFLQNWGAAFSHGTSKYLAAAAAGSTPITDSATLLNTVQLRLQPHAVAGTVMPLTFQHLLFNEGTPTVAVTNGTLTVINPPAAVTPGAAAAFALSLASPNPARAEAVFAFALPGSAAGRIAIFGIDGRAVRSAALPAGSGTWRWDLRDANGARARSGVYLARLDRPGEHAVRRVVVLD